jgi:hypothetical protein
VLFACDVGDDKVEKSMETIGLIERNGKQAAGVILRDELRSNGKREIFISCCKTRMSFSLRLFFKPLQLGQKPRFFMVATVGAKRALRTFKRRSNFFCFCLFILSVVSLSDF